MNRPSLREISRFFRARRATVVAAALALAACGGGAPAPEPPAKASFVPATGQVTVAPGTPTQMRDFAAARFLEQASFGPTPAAVADVKSRGMAAWIDAQLALPVTRIDGSSISKYPDLNVIGKADAVLVWNFIPVHSTNAFVAAPDQLRLRVAWALSNFIVVSTNKITPYGGVEYFNLLQTHALGNFGSLLKGVILNPSMGQYLDNVQNRRQGACPDCFLNENFARELMQLFTVGVFKLGLDGTMLRDGAGKPIETYSQADVQDMARALTGWTFDNKHVVRPPNSLPNANHANGAGYDKPMIASWRESHDDGAKTIMGVTIPAGQTAEQDVDSVVALLMAHPNIAPFVTFRLIQALVTSDPSPAYVARVATVFRNDGRGASGNLGAVVRAILLDPEARRGDDATVQERTVGRIKEPVMQAAGSTRALGCTRALRRSWGGVYGLNNQTPFNAPTVFSFFSPMHRAPGSNILAPEQKLLDSKEFRSRLGDISGIWNDTEGAEFARAGCRFDELTAALEKSPDHYVALLNERFFKGSMPPMLRDAAKNLLKEMAWEPRMGMRAAVVLSFMLSTPTYGVVK